jgi:hypothetical protein
VILPERGSGACCAGSSRARGEIHGEVVVRDRPKLSSA